MYRYNTMQCSTIALHACINARRIRVSVYVRLMLVKNCYLLVTDWPPTDDHDAHLSQFPERLSALFLQLLLVCRFLFLLPSTQFPPILAHCHSSSVSYFFLPILYVFLLLSSSLTCRALAAAAASDICSACQTRRMEELGGPLFSHLANPGDPSI